MRSEKLILPSLGNKPRIEIELKYPKVAILGLSGLGKTYIISRVRELRLLSEYREYLSRVITLRFFETNIEQIENTIKSVKDSMIIIDDLEELEAIENSEHIKSVIAQDFSNKYLLLGRNVQGLGLNLYWCANIKRSKGLIEISYMG